MNRSVVAFLAGTMLIAGCSKSSKQTAVEAASKAPEPLAVRTAAAEGRTIDRAVAVTGSLAPDETVTVSSEVPGRVSRILVDFGQPVRKGQVVVELDRQELEFALQRSRSALSQAMARLGLDPNAQTAEPESTPAMRQARAQMDDARSKYDNARKLVASGDISQERFTELEKAFHARQAAYEAVRDEMRTQIASLSALRADVSLAQKRLNDAVVRAPFDGSVAEKLVSPGQYTKENTPLLTVIKAYPMRLRVDIPENAAGLVRIGTTLNFTTDAVPGQQFSAVIRELNPSLDARSRSLKAEARLTQSDSRLRPGMFVQVQLVLSKATQIVAVPKDALYTVAGLTKMFVIRNGKAVELKITPGQDLGSWIEVPRESVNPGDQVAVSGLTQLINGAAVRVKS
jgi:RND family efflux transporter MFP subunit